MEKVEVEKKKKKSLFRCLFRLLFFVMFVRGIVLTVEEIKKKLNNKMEEENEGKSLKRYPCIFAGKNLSYKGEQVPDIEIDCAFSGVNIDLTGAELRKETEITIRVALGGVSVKVPPMVRVLLKAKNLASGVANMVPEYENEDLPVVNINAQMLLSGVNVQVEKEEE